MTAKDADGYPPPVPGKCNHPKPRKRGRPAERCGSVAGWGVPDTTEGPCVYHLDAPAPEVDPYPPPVEGKCNARKKRRGDRPYERCQYPAGYGTPYTVGSCKSHGGAHVSGRIHAARLTYERDYQRSVLFGETIDMPHDLGLAHVAGKFAGLAAYVEQDITRTAGDEGRVQLVEMVPAAGGGEREAVNVRIKLLMDVLAEQARVHKMALDAGVAQRQLDLVAAYQDRVVELIEVGLRAGGVNPDDPAVAEAVGRRLALVTSPGLTGGASS